jgi:hypothetical protein
MPLKKLAGNSPGNGRNGGREVAVMDLQVCQQKNGLA